MIKALLWDVDGTLLDFKAAESAAIRRLFGEFSLGECTDEMIRRYSAINEEFWQRLERNEITKQQVLIGRYEQFFAEIGVPVSLAVEFNRRYQVRLGDTIVLRDDSYSIVKSLRGRVRQYVVSNGTVIAQSRKLEGSGLGEMMDGVFLSEALGVEKPNKAFFDAVMDRICPEAPEEVMIVGDSLTSDIRGGNNAGIKTCWYNPEGKTAPDEYKIDYVIADLHEIDSLLK
jgi:2-haloacid dehalogenase